MQYGAVPSNLLERLALRLGKVPIPVLDALLPPMKARSILTAVRLGIFEALADGELKAAEVAGRRGLDPEATELLLRTLAAGEYLEQRGDTYRLTKVVRRSLLRGSPLPLWGFTEWCGQLWGTIAGLEDLVRTGNGADLHGQLQGPAAWALYQRAMLEIARFQAADLARHIPVRKGDRRLLDLGGSHGLFAATVARRHPGLAAEVLEHPDALESARELAREAGIGGEVAHRAGDLRDADLGDGELDLALLANVLHHFGAAENVALLRRIHRALRPGGRVAIWEIEVPVADAPPEIGDLAALFFRLTSGAAAFRAGSGESWLREAGFAAVRAKRLRRLPGNVLLVGEKPAAPRP